MKTCTGMLRHLFLLYLNFKSKQKYVLRAIKDTIILFLKELKRKFILELFSPVDFSDETRGDVIIMTVFR